MNSDIYEQIFLFTVSIKNYKPGKFVSSLSFHSCFKYISSAQFARENEIESLLGKINESNNAYGAENATF